MFKDKREDVNKKTVKTYKNSPFHKRKNCQNQLFQNSAIHQGLKQSGLYLRISIKGESVVVF